MKITNSAALSLHLTWGPPPLIPWIFEGSPGLPCRYGSKRIWKRSWFFNANCWGARVRAPRDDLSPLTPGHAGVGVRVLGLQLGIEIQWGSI